MFEISHDLYSGEYGSPMEEFITSRGLKQCDLIAPFLFLLTTKVLSEMMRKALSSEVLSGHEVGTLSGCISYAV